MQQEQCNVSLHRVGHRHRGHKRVKMALTRHEEVQMLRDSMEEKLLKSLDDNIPP